MKPSPFRADPVLLRHPQVLDEQHVRIDRVPAHLVDQAHLDLRSIEVGVEQREPFGLALDLVERRGAREQQHLVRDLRGGDPDLLAVDQIAAVAPFRAGLELRRVEPRVGFGHRKADLVLPAHDRGKHALLLLLRAEQHDRLQAEHRHVDARRAAHAGARFGDRLHHHRGFGDAEPRAAELGRHRDPEPAASTIDCEEIVRERRLPDRARASTRPETGSNASGWLPGCSADLR